ncbi:hypothetical protein QQX09_06575 [Demequina sp. SYSU T00192]|uniref:Pyridoxamine 5'-phosphate oxidase n=1 Tax=Demequina litoralis TaxID=3051660 RepID=A0ABT8G8P5_9MICO|nr:pyridoxamine 5'-phosphate oxidase family protein [Demequina sp. SYSU T00192]MDN4475515.1 hypothetical protein [Demequina sp. SYSU T00192]
MTAAADPLRALRDLLAAEPGVWLLGTRAADGMRTRPVRVFADEGDADLVVLTGARSRKAAELELWPEFTLAGPVAGGWLAAEGSARVVRDAAPVAAWVARHAPGVHAGEVCALVLAPARARRWSVSSGSPFDNTVATLLP